MIKNESNLDRILRVLAGVIVISQAFVGLKTPFAYLGVIFIVTGLIGFCPLYRIFGFNTCSLEHKKEQA